MALTRTIAIYKYCYECSGKNYSEVRKCAIPDCPLYPFRNRVTASKTSKEKKLEKVKK